MVTLVRMIISTISNIHCHVELKILISNAYHVQEFLEKLQNILLTCNDQQTNFQVL